MEHRSRSYYKRKVLNGLKVNPVVGIVGPRQVGKTTLAREIVEEYEAYGEQVHYFDLEHPQDVIALEQPVQALEGLKGLVVIDEVQRSPEIYTYLRVLADRKPLPAKFLVLGSASGDLLQQGSESLAGRIHYIELNGFGLHELSDLDKLWVRGGYPLSYLADSEDGSFQWRDGLIRTFLERDIPQLWERVPVVQMWRVWQMFAHYHGQTMNFSEISRSLGISNKTVKLYLDVLTDTFMIRQLTPWFNNTGKQMVKSPKCYLRDSGLLFALLGLKTRSQILGHPKLGAFWEGFAIEQILNYKGASAWHTFFWSQHSGAEMDLVLIEGGQHVGYEFKFADAPKVSKSMLEAQRALNLAKINVVIPRGNRYQLNETIEVVPLGDIVTPQQ